MTDVVDLVTRSRMMRGIGPRDTVPELAVRRYLHAAGLRFRLHGRGLAGTPDIVLPKYQTVVFVHGCFWHRHRGCRFATNPATNSAFWSAKFAANVSRDARNARMLRHLGWQVLVIWECQTRREEAIDRMFWRIVCNSGLAD